MSWKLEDVLVVSGGQTGADRGALLGAMSQSIATSGWCPKGRLAEDGVIPPVFKVIETSSDRYEDRTRLNVECSDVTLIFTYELKDAMTGGTALTERIRAEVGKPGMTIELDRDPTQEIDARLADKIRSWLIEKEPQSVNAAGPRESKAPGIQVHVARILGAVFRRPDRCVCGRQLPLQVLEKLPVGRKLVCSTCRWRFGRSSSG